MKYRSTLFYLIAAILLVGIYLYDIRHEKKKQKEEETARLLVRVNQDDLESITLRKGGQAIELRKPDDPEKKGWRILSPIRSAADSSAVASLINNLSEIMYERIIAEDTDDPASFGLDKPLFVIAFKAGEESIRLSFGSRTPLEDGYYLRKGDERKIYIIAKGDKEAMDKDLFALRTKRLFTFPLDKVKRFTIDRDSGKWILGREGDSWRFEDDQEFRVNPQKVNSMVVRFTRAEASSFEKEEVRDLEPFGLREPRARVTLWDGEKNETILLGKPVKGNDSRIYARIKEKPQVVTVSKRLLEDLPQKREEIREEEKSREDTKKSG